MSIDTSDNAIRDAMCVLHGRGNYNPTTVCHDFVELLLDDACEDNINKVLNTKKYISKIMKSKWMSNNFVFAVPSVYRSLLFYMFDKRAYELKIVKQYPCIVYAHGIISSLIAEVITKTYSDNITITQLAQLCVNRISEIFGLSAADVISEIKRSCHTEYNRFLKDEYIVTDYYTLTRMVNELVIAKIMYKYVAQNEFVTHMCKDNGIPRLHYKYLNSLLETEMFTPNDKTIVPKLATEHAILTNQYDEFLLSLNNNKSLSNMYIHRDWVQIVIEKKLYDKFTIHNIDYELNN